MKKLIIYLISIAIFISLSTCKKYEEGGRIKQTRSNLFGGHMVGDSKTWKLKLYEVNGIDSTNLINGSNVPDFYNVTFTLVDKKYFQFFASTNFQEYRGSIGTVDEELVITFKDHSYFNFQDSSQCKLINNNLICYRNIYIPDATANNRSWSVKKLTKSELIIEKTISNNYKIILTH